MSQPQGTYRVWKQGVAKNKGRAIASLWALAITLSLQKTPRAQHLHVEIRVLGQVLSLPAETQPYSLYLSHIDTSSCYLRSWGTTLPEKNDVLLKRLATVL